MNRSLILSLMCVFASPVLASGQLDPRFGVGGVLLVETTTNAAITDLLEAGLVDSQGRYVGVGRTNTFGGNSGLVLRIQPGGQRDASFGIDGVARVPTLAPYGNVFWADVVEQPDGRLIVAGRAGNAAGGANPGKAYVCRLLPNGALDPSFGTEGCTAPAFSTNSDREAIVAIALQADGRIVLTGNTDLANDGIPFEYVVARLDADGGYDPCFGDPGCQTGGRLIRPEPQADLPDFFVNDVALAPDGRIVVAGSADGPSGSDMAVIRLLSTGSVDVGGFGNGGHRLVAFEQGGFNADTATSVVVRANGSIVLAGTVQTATGFLGGIAALDAFGAPINSFGVAGKQVFFFNDVSPVHRPTAMVEQADGKLLVGGYTDNDLNAGDFYADCGVARFSAAGQPDTSFGFDGINNLDSGLGAEPIGPDACFGLDVDGRSILLFGQGVPDDDEDNDAMLMRLDQDDLFRDGFEDQD